MDGSVLLQPSSGFRETTEILVSNKLSPLCCWGSLSSDIQTFPRHVFLLMSWKLTCSWFTNAVSKCEISHLFTLNIKKSRIIYPAHSSRTLIFLLRAISLEVMELRWTRKVRFLTRQVLSFCYQEETKLQQGTSSDRKAIKTERKAQIEGMHVTTFHATLLN